MTQKARAALHAKRMQHSERIGGAVPVPSSWYTCSLRLGSDVVFRGHRSWWWVGASSSVDRFAPCLPAEGARTGWPEMGVGACPQVGRGLSCRGHESSQNRCSILTERFQCSCWPALGQGSVGQLIILLARPCVAARDFSTQAPRWTRFSCSNLAGHCGCLAIPGPDYSHSFANGDGQHHPWIGERGERRRSHARPLARRDRFDDW